MVRRLQCSLLARQLDKVVNALVEQLLLQIRSDGLHHTIDDSADQMTLLDASLDILHFDLVVEATLHLAVQRHETLTVGGLQLQADVLLLGSHQHRVSLGRPLRLLLVRDRLVEFAQLRVARLGPLLLDLVHLLVGELGHGWAHLLDRVHDHNHEGETGIKLVLHDEDLLGAQVRGQTGAEHVRTSDTRLLVEELEPKDGRVS